MSWIQSLNPIILREMRSRLRGRRTLMIMILYVGLLALLAGTVYTILYRNYILRGYYGYYPLTASYNAYTSSFPNPGVSIAEFGPDFGRALFSASVFLQVTLFGFIATAFGAAAITGEKDRQTYDTLLITKLGARQIVWGKILANFILLLLFIALALPIQFMALAFGGVALADLLIATLILAISVLAFILLGLYVSTWARSTTTAVTISYAILLGINFVLPLFFYIIAIIVSFNLGFTNQIQSLELFLSYVSYLTLSINPFSASIASGTAIFDGQGYFLLDASNIFLGIQGRVPSPWITYCLFHLLVIGLLIKRSTRNIQKISKV